MKNKIKNRLIVLLAVVSVLCSVFFVACKKNPTSGSNGSSESVSESVAQGEEKGEYYFADVDAEQTLELDGNGAFEFVYNGETLNGSYVIDGENVKLNFASGAVNAVLANDILSLEYNGAAMRFYKKVMRTVTLVVGSTETTASILNGQKFAQPEAPSVDGKMFIGWYKTADFKDGAYVFETEIVTEDITLYARLVDTATDVEFTVTFDTLCSVKAPDPVTTINKTVYGALETPVREGYTFKGWWISYENKGEKLSYKYDETAIDGVTLDSDTTFFALWEEDGKETFDFEVKQGRAWWSVNGSASLSINGPEGYSYAETFGATAASSYVLDFSDKPAGEYVFTLISGGKSVTRYFTNKALTRVSGFLVTDTVLGFNKVANADKYVLSVYCGISGHNHSNIELAGETYNFANCKIPADGIKFKVVAQNTNGTYAPSEAWYVYTKQLAAVENLAYNDKTGKLTWNAVENARYYLLTVNGTEYLLNGETEFDLSENAVGEYEVTVVAIANGYASSKAVTVNAVKTLKPVPADITVNGTLLTWTEIEGATYKVLLGSDVKEVETNSFDLSSLNLEDGAHLTIKVKAVFADGESPWSEVLNVRNGAFYNELTYKNGVISWRPVVGADKYEVSVNDVAFEVIGANSAEITLTKSGDNTVKVRYYDEKGNVSKWTETTITAYEVLFDVRGGAVVNPIYKAYGDLFTLPEANRTGYEFDGWFNVAGGAEANGAEYEDGYFEYTENKIFYANWAPVKYEIKLDYGNGGVGEADTSLVPFGRDYLLPVPTVTDMAQMFSGWYSTASGEGIQYTDEFGVSVKRFGNTTGVTMYARYVTVFEFTPDGDDCLEVKASSGLSYYATRLVIPAEYEGKRVRSIAEYGFKGKPYITYVEIPDTIEFIAATAFDGCSRIEEYVLREEGAIEPRYKAVEGSLIETYLGETKIAFIPAAQTGVYRVPVGVTQIGGGAFKSKKFEAVIIPSSVTLVAANAFENCGNLKTIAFEATDKGEEEQSLVIDMEAFDGADKLEKLTLPARLAEFDDAYKFFAQFNSLQSITIVGESKNQVYASLDDLTDGGKNVTGILTDADKSTIIYCPKNIIANVKTAENPEPTEYEIEIPSKILFIAAHAFDAYGGELSTKQEHTVTSVIFHSGIRDIGEQAFYKAKNLRSVVFKGAVKSQGFKIGDKAFYLCGNLETVTFEETGTTDGKEFTVETSCRVSYIGESAFYGCSIKELLLPCTLTELGNRAFSGNKALKLIDLSHVNSQLKFGAYAFERCGIAEITITDNVGEMEFNSVFYKCTSLKKVEVSPTNENYQTGEDGVLYNKGATKIIYYPDGLTGEYVIPDTVLEIGGAVFLGKDNITKIIIPASVTRIGESAFEECNGLVEVIFEDGGTEDLEIGDKAFYNCLTLVSIVFPERTVSIGEECFRKYGHSEETQTLSNVVLNEGLKTIGKNAFYNTDSLKTLTIPSTVEYIGNDAFGSSNLEKVVFAESDDRVELTLGTYLFSFSTNLVEVIFPEGLTSIPQQTFNYCLLLEKVNVPSTVRNIDGVAAIGDKAFASCEKLSELNFALGGKEPLSFGLGVFTGCSALKELNLPERASALNGTYDLFNMGKNSYFNQNVYKMYGDNSMTGSQVYPLEQITVADEEGIDGQFASYDGVLYTNDLTTVVFCPFGRKGEVEIAKEATTFRPCAFFVCSQVTSIVFQDGGTEDLVFADVSSTGSNSEAVFYGCRSLETIAFPARLTKIGKLAFYNSNSMTVNGVYTDATAVKTITFADGCKLAEIGEQAFRKSYITRFEMPSGVETIGKNAFAECKSLTEIVISDVIDEESLIAVVSSAPALQSLVIPETNKLYIGKESGKVIYTKDESQIIYVASDFECENYVIPTTVTSIPDNLFKGIVGVKKITFEATPADMSENALTIGQYAFSASGITEIVIPKRVNAIGNYAFSGCKSLASVEFEEGFTHSAISQYMFQNCTALTEITIPSSVTSIGRGAFHSAGIKTEDKETGEVTSVSGLTTVTFGRASDGMISQLTNIGADAFNNCYALKNFRVANLDGTFTYDVLPELVAEIGKTGTYISGPFTNCISITKMVLADSMTEIPKNLFNGCASLETVVFPSNLTTIKAGAFIGSGIKNFTLDGVTSNKVVIEEEAFKNCTKLETVDFSKVGTLCGYYTFAGCTSLKEVNIPSTVTLKYKSTTATSTMAFYTFKDCTSLESATLPFAVQKNMFTGCTALKTVTLSSSNANKIAQSAFAGCTALETVNLSATSNITIDQEAFSGCTALANIDVSKAKIINKKAFYNCESLTSVTFNNSLTTINESAFEGTGITSLVIPSTITTINNYAFGSTKLTSVILPETVKTVKSGIFRNCLSLTEASFESTMNNIPASTFFGCTALKTVSFGDNIVTINDSAFENCSSLETIDLTNVTLVNQKAFQGCTALKTIKIGTAFPVFYYGGTALNGVNATFEVPDGSLLTVDGGIVYDGTTLLLDIDKKEVVTVLDGTTKIAMNAFRNNTYVKEIILPESLTEIEGYFTFAGCTNLQSINLEKVTTYSKGTYNGKQDKSVSSMFKGCDNLGEITVSAMAEQMFAESGVKKVTLTGKDITIPKKAFYKCTSLTNVYGMKNVVEIGESAFEGATQVEFDTYDFSEVKLGTYAFKGNEKITEITISGINLKGAKTIENSVFTDCVNLTTVKIANSVTSVGGYVFQRCGNLTSITMVDGSNPFTEVTKLGYSTFDGVAVEAFSFPKLTSINPTMFANNANLKSVDLPKITTTSAGMFKNCTSLVTVNMPNITTLNSSVFEGCTSLETVTFDLVKSVSSSTFKGCTALTTVNLPLVTSTSSSSFEGCSALTTVNMPLLATVGASSFKDCVLLASLDISKVTKIGENAFDGCTALSLEISSLTTEIGANAFNCWTAEQTITVPYENAESLPANWKDGWDEGCEATIVWKQA